MDGATLVDTPPDFDDYDCHRVVGVGANGQVFGGRPRAHAAGLSGISPQGEVVFKRLTGPPSARLAAGLGLVRGLDCPGLATPLGLARDREGSWWVVSALASGRPLQPGPVEPGRATTEGLGLARALHALHERGVHHGDVSPGNVLGDRDGKVTLIDFGSLGAHGTGTPGFLAPEVLGGLGGPAADLFALGALMFFRLTGQTPWRTPEAVVGSTAPRVRRTVQQAARESRGPGEQGPSWPKGLAALLEDLLHPDPEVRLRRSGRVTERLARISAGGRDEVSRDRAEGVWSVPAHLPWEGPALAGLGAWMEGTVDAEPDTESDTEPVIDPGGRVVLVSGPPGAGRGRALRELALIGAARTHQVPRWWSEPAEVAGEDLEARWARFRRVWLTSATDALWCSDVLDVSGAEEAPEVCARVARKLLASVSMRPGTVVLRVTPAMARACEEANAEGTARLRVLELSPLSEAELERLVSRTFSGLATPGAWAKALLRHTGGWPGRVARALHHLQREGVSRPDDVRVLECATPGPTPLSPAEAREIMARLWGDESARVPARSLAGATVTPAAAVQARTVLGPRVREMARAALASRGDARAVSQGALEAGLALALDADDGAQIDAFGRRALSVGAPLSEPLRRWVEETPPHEHAALRAACAEALVRRGEVEAAAQLLERTPDAIIPRARALHRLGDVHGAQMLLREAAEDPRRGAALRLRARALLWRLQDPEDAPGRPGHVSVHEVMDAARQLAAAAEVDAPIRDAVEVDVETLAWAEACLWGGFRLMAPGTSGEASRALVVAEAWGARTAGLHAAGLRARALQLLGNMALGRGDLRESIGRLEHASLAFERAGEPEGCAAIDATLAALAWATGRPHAAIDRGRRAFDHALVHGRLDSAAVCLVGLTPPLCALGRGDEARRRWRALDVECGTPAPGDGLDAARARCAGVKAAVEHDGRGRGGALTPDSWAVYAAALATAAATHASLGLDVEAIELRGRAARAFVHAGAPLRAREVLEAGRDAAEWRGDELDVDVAWSLALAEAMASGEDGPRRLQHAARRLPGPESLWRDGRRMAALEVTYMGAHLAETWDDLHTAARLAQQAAAYLETIMDEMSTNERREMTRGMLEAAPSNALLDALGLRAPSGGPSGAPGDDTTPSTSPAGSATATRPPETSVTAARAAHLESLLRAYRRLAREDGLERVLEQVVEAMMELTHAERGTAVVRRDGEGTDGEGTLVEVSRELEGEEAAKAYSASIIQRVLADGEPVLSLDAAADARFEMAGSVTHLNLRSVLAVPLVFRGRVVGAVYVDHRLRRGVFDERDLSRVEELADLAALAVAHALQMERATSQTRALEAARRELEQRLDQTEVEMAGLRATYGQRAAGASEDFHGMVARSPGMHRLFRLVERVASTPMPVVIAGESGTGKELVARAVHRAGSRRDGPFIAENCGAMPENLLESILFGHAKGAFTGAHRASPGLFEAADGGVIFLDEIGEMSPAMQTKLLRVLQEGEVRRVGEQRVRKVSVRVVAATHRDLEAMVQAGTFRQDLFYRLCVVRLELPPLRERREDVPLLVEHFLSRHGADALGVSASAMRALLQYPWPGNVRELENEIQRWVALCEETVTPDDLSPQIAGSGEADGLDPDDLRIREHTERLERSLVARALARTEGNLTQAAKLLGLSRYGLQKKIKRLDELEQAGRAGTRESGRARDRQPR